MFRILGGIYFGWSLGANDAANIFGTAVATRLVKFSTAVILIAIFVLIGSVLEGPKCMKVMSDIAKLTPNLTLVVTIAAAITMTLLTIFGIPASSSQAIMGAIVGATILRQTPNWGKFGGVVLCWIGTPFGAAIIAFIMYKVFEFFFNKTIGMSGSKFNSIIKVGILLSGCFGAYSLGANNVANVTGIYVGAGLLTPFMASLIGAISIIIGVATYSKNVMVTVGSKITVLGPMSALVAVFSMSLTLWVYTHIGVPVSSSQAIVGAVTGIGFVRGIKSVNFKMIGEIFIGWLTTPLSAGILAFLGSLIIH